MKGWLVAQRTFELWPSTLMWFGKSDSTSFSQGLQLLDSYRKVQTEQRFEPGTLSLRTRGSTPRPIENAPCILTLQVDGRSFFLS